MRHADLRTFFLRLSMLAAPLPIGAAACGGNVNTGSHGEHEGAGDDDDDAGGAINTGTGGVYGTGGYSGYAPGYPLYPGSGGAPIYVGSGGYPVNVGSGGVPIYVGLPALDAGPATTDGGGPDPEDGGAAEPSDAADLRDAVQDAYQGSGGSGRRPPGLAPMARRSRSAVCAYFEGMAMLEAASVPAFRLIRRELGVHGAPRALRRSALVAARDEVVHTRLGRALAERYGGTYTPPRITPRPPRSLEEFAIDNAVEGGVRETFGAMIATWQARASADPVVRKVMRRVAADETRHAALAIRIDAWAKKRLGERYRAVHDARREAVRQIERELAVEPSTDLVAIAGVPSGKDALGLLHAMNARIWA